MVAERYRGGASAALAVEVRECPLRSDVSCTLRTLAVEVRECPK